MGTRLSGALVTLGASTAIAVTAASGTPSSLPDLALDSSVLFHLERALALLAGWLVLLLVVSRAWGGELPSAISTQGVIYSAEAAKAEASLTVKELRAELELLRSRVEQFEDAE